MKSRKPMKGARGRNRKGGRPGVESPGTQESSHHLDMDGSGQGLSGSQGGNGRKAGGSGGMADLPERVITVPKKYVFGFIALIVLTGFAIWFFFMRTNPYIPVAGTYCGNQSGTDYCYELKDNGTYVLHVRKTDSDQETTFESKYGVEDGQLTLDSPNEQIGIRTVFTVQGDRLCAGSDCRFTKQ